MKIAFVGCGYVFDIYMRTRWAHDELEICGVFDIDSSRLKIVCHHYGLKAYSSYSALLADAAIDIVVNLTNIGAHYGVTKRALEAGKHVYSEKPITNDLDQTKELFEIAEKRGSVLAAAPSNMFSDSICTIWKAITDGAIGKPVLIYAELDDNPAHLMGLENVRSPTGAPFPYAEELQEGCTIEHIAYHLVWLCAIFGPVHSITAFSKFLVAHKTATELDPADTPDLSIACLEFANGVAARVTCSWVAPRDHRFRIIGDEGELSADNVFHDQSPVTLERFSRLSLAARKAQSFRKHPQLGRRFGVGGRKLRLIRRWRSHAVEAERGVSRSLKHKLVSWLRRKEVYAQDKMLGIAEMTRALEHDKPQAFGPDFLIHINELTLLVHGAGSGGISQKPTTSFAPAIPLPALSEASASYRTSYRGNFLERLLTPSVAALHK